MIAALDVCYGAQGAATACVLFARWTDASPAGTHLARLADVAPYEPGAFYKRELPCLLAALAMVEAPLEAIVIDGYVYLSAEGRPGLGAHLFEATGERTPIVGVAKTSFTGSPFAEAVIRGESARPLFVTAAGVDQQTAAGWIRAMHGPHRLPTLLKLADRLCRDAG